MTTADEDQTPEKASSPRGPKRGATPSQLRAALDAGLTGVEVITMQHHHEGKDVRLKLARMTQEKLRFEHPSALLAYMLKHYGIAPGAGQLPAILTEFPAPPKEVPVKAAKKTPGPVQDAPDGVLKILDQRIEELANRQDEMLDLLVKLCKVWNVDISQAEPGSAHDSSGQPYAAPAPGQPQPPWRPEVAGPLPMPPAVRKWNGA